MGTLKHGLTNYKVDFNMVELDPITLFDII